MRISHMKLVVPSLVLSVLSLPALAGHDYDDVDRYQDTARVISAQPQFERVNSPRQECRTEYVRESYYESRNRSNTGAVIGGVTGGLLGSTIGRGNGRVAAAVVGAGVGAIVGDRVDNDRYAQGRQRVETRPVERCVTVDNWNNVQTGYLVIYQYNGRQYTTVTQNHPGDRIPVNVSIDGPRNYVTQVVYDDPRVYDGGWGNRNWDDGGRKGRHHRHRNWW